ncbi:hypothetical protein WJX77_000294 [Trebouxia sp. C0004]
MCPGSKGSTKAARDKAALCTQLQAQLDQLCQDSQADKLKAQQLLQEHDDAKTEEQHNGQQHQSYLKEAMAMSRSQQPVTQGGSCLPPHQSHKRPLETAAGREAGAPEQHPSSSRADAVASQTGALALPTTAQAISPALTTTSYTSFVGWNVTSDRRSRQQTCKGPKCSRATKNSCASNMALLTSPQQCCEEPQDKGRSQCHAFGW